MRVDSTTPPLPLVRRCSKCGVVRAARDFYIDPKTGTYRASCKDCHSAYRKTNRNRILAWEKEYRERNRDRRASYWREYMTANGDRVREHDRQRYLANAEKKRASARAYRETNREQVRAADKRWREENHSKLIERNRKRRARERSSFIETVDFDAVFLRDKARCGICHKQVDRRDASLDHVVPLVIGGEHSYRNVQLAHRLCNSIKGRNVIEQVRLI